MSKLILSNHPESLRYFGVFLNYPLSRYVSASGGHGSQKCYKLIDRFEAEVIVSVVLIGQF